MQHRRIEQLKRFRLAAVFAVLLLSALTFNVTLAAKAYAAPAIQSLGTASTHTFAADYKPPDCTGGNATAACIIDNYINPWIKALSALAGVAIVASVIYGGIQYSSAGGDPSKVAAAKGRIGKAIGALLFFIFLYAFLNYMLPGGI